MNNNIIKLKYKLIIPALILLFAVILFPLAYSLFISFFDYTLVHPTFEDFLFLENYLKAFQDTYFWNSVFVTLIFTIGVVLLEFIIGFILAYYLNKDVKYKNVFFSILIIPMLMTPVAVGLIWRMILHPQQGILNYLLGLVGIPAFAWLGNKYLALPTVMLVDIWHQVPFMMLLMLAGLVSLPKRPYEAAKIDGASRLQMFRYITLPLMKPTIIVAVLIRTIIAFRTYDLVYIMTKGGPGVRTDILSYYIYKRAFAFMDIGFASALSYILLLFVGFVSIFFIRATLSQD
mgnify:CR=1 FL=1